MSKYVPPTEGVTAPPDPYFSDEQITLHLGDSLTVLRQLPDASVDCCVTSPPYFGLRDYGVDGQYGLEASPAEYVETMRSLFAEVRRVLADDGTLWLNIGDSYVGSSASSGKRDKDAAGVSRPAMSKLCEACGTGFEGNVGRRFCSAACGGTDNSRYAKRGVLAPKNLLGIPWRTAFALQDDGWILRNDVIWAKPNAMPESVSDRLSCRHEHLFMLTKSRSYWFDLDPIREPAATANPADPSFRANGKSTGRRKPVAVPPGSPAHALETGRRDGITRNPGDVWTISTQPFSDAHFAVMPPLVAERAVLAGCKPNGTVLDPFSGSGTTGMAATKHGRKYVGIDLSREYLDLSLRTRFAEPGLDFGGAA